MPDQKPSPFENTPFIKKEGVAEKVINHVRAMVQSGNLKAGDKLPPERELTSIFNVSRPSLREAMRSLSIMGIVESRQGGGAFITDLNASTLLAPLDFFISLSENNVAESFECRRLIEMEIARKCARNASEDDKRELREMLDAQKQISDDAVTFRILDTQFHAKLFDMAGNSVMERLADGFYNLGLEVRRIATKDSSVVRQSLKDHEAIVGAINAGDAHAAAEAMRQHLVNIEQTTIAAMGQARS